MVLGGNPTLMENEDVMPKSELFALAQAYKSVAVWCLFNVTLTRPCIHRYYAHNTQSHISAVTFGPLIANRTTGLSILTVGAGKADTDDCAGGAIYYV